MKRAVQLLSNAIDSAQGDVYCLGDIVHNPGVVNSFEKRGAKFISRAEEAPPGATVVIRAHGAKAEEFHFFKRNNNTIIDATCKRVEKIRIAITEALKEGKHIYIAGHPDHPEVAAYRSLSPENITVIPDPESVAGIDFSKAGIFVSQTTVSPATSEQVASYISKKADAIETRDTVCLFTTSAQDAARELASECDAMIVIGGRSSSNTRRLFEACRQACPNTVQVESPDEIDPAAYASLNVLGITAGASTPEEDVLAIVNLFKNNK